MGKAEDEQQPLPAFPEDPPQNAETECRCRCARIRKLVGFRCILVLLLSVALFLSALFWLPPFLRLADQKNLRDSYQGHDIVASFILNSSKSLLEDNKLKLAGEILEEIETLSAKVVIVSLDTLSGPNKTKVVFAVDCDDEEDKQMCSASISLIKASFTSLVIRQSYLHLTSSSLFGDPFFFEVLKFNGGITIIPQQNAFPLQKVQAIFSFNLNVSIYQIQSNFNELTSQLKSGLQLSTMENLHVSLSNSEGSTVDAPTVVQSSVLLAVGIPSKQRLKQLAQTIMGPHNLGLNHTEFGRVKQVRLSSISLHGNDSNGSAGSPSPTPEPHPLHHHHHHHQHHHHHHHHTAHLTPETSPAPVSVPILAPTPTPTPGEGETPPKADSPAAVERAPAPGENSQAEPPNCRFRFRKRSTHRIENHPGLTPTLAPSIGPHYHAPVASPKPPVEPPDHVSHSVPVLSPLPNVAFAHTEPPPKSEPDGEHSHTRSQHVPLLSSSSAGCLGNVKWTPLFMVLVLHI